ncbi:Pls/PosA family non-ribosomal peptide synthetase [Corynebacterium aquilae]|uniref:Amino acid adenylation protein n=1 Tax=Corynebacterium aquilae DSM 44791 TaxID=1431546 RepID=A0A1L7CI23_9CORY|nr:Pls/PosA family non-ribosomal peptide synthetase [Corynebacterium aquilae]APT85507.1 amino acid adenylation protein [Corynebacterium aquilae DSM 44791]
MDRLLNSPPPQFLLQSRAPAPRTLVEILQRTAADFPDAAAIDDGSVLTYQELVDEVFTTAEWLASVGIGRGDRVGIRMPSGSRNLYIAILSTLAAGAAYVPVDADDPDERAEIVFGQAGVSAIFTGDGLKLVGEARPARRHELPGTEDDAWIIFTSGSTGLPKGVAVTHRNAAAFVDAEAQLFCQDEPLGPEDRVLAGLSVAFDASCEEMWLAWRHGACLVPAPRSLVRSGMDLGPWLVSRDVSVVSTVPTLASMWPAEALDGVRLMIFGGEACPAELVRKLCAEEREVWNTYGPTEATVVTCAALMAPDEEVSIGLPLAGWDMAVVDADGYPVSIGQSGELIIGGVGLARYLDADKDAQVYAPLPSLGWQRAYRSGDMVRLEEDGVYFVGRTDDQVKIGGRRIELGEVSANVAAAPGVNAAAVVVRQTPAGDKLLVAYLSPEDPATDWAALSDGVRAFLQERMPAALVPRIHVMDPLPVTTSGKVDKKSLPWPLPGADVTAEGLTPCERFVAEAWLEELGVAIEGADADFFHLGGTSLAAAALVARLRENVPTVSVRDVYDHPRLGALAERLVQLGWSPEAAGVADDGAPVALVGAGTRVGQAAGLAAALLVRASVWLAWIVLGVFVAGRLGAQWAPPVGLVQAILAAVWVSPVARLPLSALSARVLCAGLTPGDYPRGGVAHLRVWVAERIQDAFGAHGLGGAVWINSYARMLGCRLGRGVTLHTVPPVTGMLSAGDFAAIGPEVDVLGYWVDSTHFHLGRVTIGAHARVDARSTLGPGAVVGAHAHIEPGSLIDSRTKVKDHSRWAGNPAVRVGRPKRTFPLDPPPRARRWLPVYVLIAGMVGLLPYLCLGVGAAGLWAVIPDSAHGVQAAGYALLGAPLGALLSFGSYMAATWVGVRVMQRGLDDEIHPVRSWHGVRMWAATRLMDEARRHLFPIYAAQLTPYWLRSLGARIGKDAEISTAVMIPALTDVRDESFLADDTMVGGYEVGNGWLKTGAVRVGRRSFVGNSGMVAPGRKVRKNSLVAVLSSAPKKAKAGSNWMGSPPVRLRRVQVCAAGGEAVTYQPPLAKKVARATVETGRLLAPMTSFSLAVGAIATIIACWTITSSLVWAWLATAGVLVACGIVALGITVLMKWACVGRIAAGSHPLWTRFIWLNELQDAFVESVAAPWLLDRIPGTGTMATALRLLGAKIGKGTWLETYWLPEADLCVIGDGVSVNRGCVVQTHLFQDRVMSLDSVSLGEGSSVGPHSVVLPASKLGRRTWVGPASLVMRGDVLPGGSRWQGNTVEPYPTDDN